MVILFLIACTEATPEDIAAMKAVSEHNRLRTKCMSKSSGSQPECWDEEDWESFCERVACKKQ